MNQDLYFEIYSKGEYHYQWQKHIEYADRCDHVTEKYRNDWVEALHFFRNELGKNFLKNCGKNHPLLHVVQSKGDWQTDELIEILKLLTQLKSTEKWL
ncbi:MAG: hypothetical protein HC867_02600 [Bacteroidia bacterium]|nr:hypothetical protein [Bacteroidia bacterium]